MVDCNRYGLSYVYDKDCRDDLLTTYYYFSHLVWYFSVLKVMQLSMWSPCFDLNNVTGEHDQKNAVASIALVLHWAVVTMFEYCLHIYIQQIHVLLP